MDAMFPTYRVVYLMEKRAGFTSLTQLCGKYYPLRDGDAGCHFEISTYSGSFSQEPQMECENLQRVINAV